LFDHQFFSRGRIRSTADEKAIDMPLRMPNTNEPPSPTPAPGKGIGVERLFGTIARKYDTANHLLSGGMDFLWRRRAASIVKNEQPKRILDVATGSGDLALALQKACPDASVTGTDFCQPMLDQAALKGLKDLVLADALAMPFGDGQFDVLTVAFGLRNMEDWPRALREMRRVIRSGGLLLVLDFSVPPPPLRGIYRFYLHNILPCLASIVTGEKSAYDYLADSIEVFPSGEKMTALIESCGYRDAKAERLTGGIVSLYTARRNDE
jgi:demethylmenaquinone methyltransferase / 2-methoxy-6-polyprenyl-1,4-benzoquinol methylase